MRLPRFLDREEYNNLRRQMRAPLGEFTLRTQASNLSIDDLDRRLDAGIDIEDLAEVVMLPDRTLIYEGRRVILYIRDVAVMSHRSGDASTLPRFHVANCSTLRDMRARNRYSRYVVAARDNGTFAINSIRDSVVTSKDERLHVCQNCLGELSYDDFKFDMTRDQRATHVERFSIGKFFLQYPRGIVSDAGLDGERSAPINDYTGDFGAHAHRAKADVGWTCQSCQTNLADQKLRRYLHAHHVNGLKHNNSPANLLVLCIRCHAGQPGHAHMQAQQAFQEYCQLGL